MKTDDRNELLDILSVCYGRINRLRILCEENNQPEKAAQLRQLKGQMKNIMDDLSRGLYRDWVGDAGKLKGTISQSNEALEACIDDVE